VSRTQSFIPETSSGSSAVAVAIKETYKERKKQGILSYDVFPPSGIPIRTTVYREGDEIRQAFIEGPVKLVGIRRMVYKKI
jgi:hypothetical protein